jgi:phosphoserine phosphatase
VNRRGEEKARCLRELMATREDPDTFAYGNAGSDLPHLRLARRGVLVNGSLAARRAAAEAGITILDWT